MRRYGIIRKTLKDTRLAAVAVGSVVFLIAWFDVLVYPQYRDALGKMQMPDVFRGFIGEAGSWATPEGFMGAEFFSWIPLLLITVAIIGGTGALAGEEGAGTLDLLLAQPISRRRLLLEKVGGIAVAITLAAAATLPGFLLGRLFVEMDLGAGRMIAAAISMLPLTFLFLTLSLWTAAALPDRAAAVAATIGVVVVTYVINLMGAALPLLETPRKLSPFYWADSSRVLIHGFDWARSGGLLAVAALFLALAARAFEQRDLSGRGHGWGLALRARRRATPPFDTPAAHGVRPRGADVPRL